MKCSTLNVMAAGKLTKSEIRSLAVTLLKLLVSSSDPILIPWAAVIKSATTYKENVKTNKPNRRMRPLVSSMNRSLKNPLRAFTSLQQITMSRTMTINSITMLSTW